MLLISNRSRFLMNKNRQPLSTDILGCLPSKSKLRQDFTRWFLTFLLLLPSVACTNKDASLPPTETFDYFPTESGGAVSNEVIFTAKVVVHKSAKKLIANEQSLYDLVVKLGNLISAQGTNNVMFISRNISRNEFIKIFNNHMNGSRDAANRFYDLMTNSPSNIDTSAINVEYKGIHRTIIVVDKGFGSIPGIDPRSLLIQNIVTELLHSQSPNGRECDAVDLADMSKAVSLIGGMADKLNGTGTETETKKETEKISDICSNGQPLTLVFDPVFYELGFKNADWIVDLATNALALGEFHNHTPINPPRYAIWSKPVYKGHNHNPGIHPPTVTVFRRYSISNRKSHYYW